MMTIRSYQPADAPVLAHTHNTIYPEQPHTPESFQRRLSHLPQVGGRVWVLEGESQEQGRVVVGYAAVAPIPGLPGLVNLEGFIAPAWQRQGAGSYLLLHLLPDLRQSQVRQVSCSVASLDSPAAHFLHRHGFFVEHEEWEMALTPWPLSPSPLPDNNFHWQTYSRSKAIKLFCSLYEQSFGGLPWFQPYSHDEAAASLKAPEDILFLTHTDIPFGFVWTPLETYGHVEIEPIGVVKEYHGQGLGRLLLLAGVQRLAEQGAPQIRLGVWRENQAAIHLYQSAGFQRQRRLIYLAYNLDQMVTLPPLA
jgi:ribosomal protein S18 acetylase RimI-like enzyme